MNKIKHIIVRSVLVVLLVAVGGGNSVSYTHLPAGRPVAATLCARPVERMARRPPRKHRVAVVVPDRRCRQLRRLLPRQEEK